MWWEDKRLKAQTVWFYLLTVNTNWTRLELTVITPKTYQYFNQPNTRVNLHVLGLWEEVWAAGGNPRRHTESTQTPHRWNPATAFWLGGDGANHWATVQPLDPHINGGFRCSTVWPAGLTQGWAKANLQGGRLCGSFILLLWLPLLLV